MGIKSRSNFRIGLCMRGDCAERDKLCDTCIRFSNYREITLRELCNKTKINKHISTKVERGRQLEGYE